MAQEYPLEARCVLTEHFRYRTDFTPVNASSIQTSLTKAFLSQPSDSGEFLPRARSLRAEVQAGEGVTEKVEIGFDKG